MKFSPGKLLSTGLVMLAALAAVTPPTQGSSCTPPPAGLVGWWQAEGTPNDSAGTNNGVLSASGASYASGKVGQGFRFDGTNGCLQIPDADALKPATVTLEAWVWLDPNVSPGLEVIVFKKNSRSFFFEGYNLLKERVDNGNGTFTDHFSFVISSVGGSQVATRSTTVVQRGVWYHVAATYDGNKATIWVNGVAEASNIAGFALDYGTRPVFIGTSGEAAPYDNFLAGIIDEASIYGRALATNEIAAIYNAGSAGKCPPTATCTPPPAGIVGWWPGEGNASDVVGGNNGTLQPGVTFATGEVGQGFNFNGSAVVTIPDQPALNPTNQMTMECWIYPHARPAGAWTQNVFEKDSECSGVRQYKLIVGDSPSHLGAGDFRAHIGVPSGFQVVDGATVVQSNTWYHVAQTYDGTTLKLYVNGVLDGQLAVTGPIVVTPEPLRFGGGPTGCYSQYLFDGELDEPAIYNRALSSNEIAAIYLAGSAGKCAPASGCATYANFNSTSGLNLIGSAAVTNGVLRLTPAIDSQTGDAWLTTKQPCASGFDTTFHFAISQLGNIYNAELGGDGFTLSVQNLGPTNNAWAMGDTNQFVAVFFNTFWNWPGCTCPDVSDNSVGILVNQNYIAQTDLNPLGINMSDGATHLAHVNYNGTGLTVWVDGVMVLTNVLLAGLHPGTDASGQGWVGFTAGTGGAYENHDILDWSFCLTSNAVPTSGVPVILNFSPVSGTNGAVVTISGNNFSPVAANNIVYFGAVRANVVAASPASLTVTVPTGATYAPITVSVGGLIAYANAPFLVTFAGSGFTALAPRLDLPASDGPGFVAFADLDGDGKPDLVVLSSIISIYQNISTNGTVTAGSFAPRVDLALPSGADAMTVADVDGDGKLDIVILNRNSNQVMILKNIAPPGLLTTNSFAAPVAFSTGSDPRGVAVQDLDGDGKPELIVANWGDNTVSVFHNTGATGLTTNSFAPAVTFAVGTNPQGLAVADLDGDGKPDVVTANNNYATDNSVSVLRNTSSPGNISFASHVDLAGMPTSYGIAVGDLDGDGKLDLAVSSFINGQAVSVYRNTSTPGSLTTNSFAPHVDFDAGGWGNAVAIGDLDGDGKPDLAVVTQLPDHLSIFKNISTPGSFTTGSLAPRVDYAAGWNPNGVAIGDLDGDGRPDIAFAVSYAATLSIYQNETTPAVTTPGTNPPAITAIAPKIGAPGTNILITGTNFNPVAASNIVYFGAVRANVLAASPNSLTVTVPTGATFAPITVTVNGLVASSSQPFEPTFTGNGSNISSSSFAPSFNLGTGGGPGSSVIADLDGDGKPDIALVTSDNHSVAIFRNISTNGALLSAASFAPRVDLPFPTAGTSGNPYRLRAVDLDGDGRLDLIACEVYGNRVSVFHNIATPGALTTSSFETSFALIAGSDCRFATAADLDGDGRVDIVALNYGDKTISLFKNIGAAGSLTTSSFAPPVLLAAPGGPYEVAIADLDGDGKLDLAVAESDSGTVSIFQNVAVSGVLNTNSFAASFDMPCGVTTSTIMAADLDGDGKLDLVAGSPQSDNISIFRNTSTGGVLTSNSFASRVDFATGYWTHTVAIADFNGDGKPDINVVGELPSVMSIFQNASTPGSFTGSSLAPRVDFGTGWNAWGVAAGDLDGDGRPDIVFCNAYESNIQIYQNVAPFAKLPPVCTPAPSGLVGWWQGENNAQDATGANNGALLGGTSFAPGEVGQAFAFTVTNVAVVAPASASLDVGAGNGFTLEAWINPTDVTQTHPLFEWNNSTYWGVHFHIAPGQPFNVSPGPGELYANIVDSFGGWHQMSSAGGVVASNVFQHVALTYDKASGVATIYCNGAIVSQQNLGGFTPLTSYDLFLGRRPAPSGEDSAFAGLMDEPSVYNRALSTAEIQAIYNAGSAGKCPILAAPVIVTQPASQTNLSGTTASFTVTATGTQPLSYQWNFNGTNISGATNSTLLLTNLQVSQAGNYAVLVTNTYGAAASSNAMLTVLAIPPTILSQTPSQVVLLGNTATFSVNVSGTDPLSYFWKRNGAFIPGATNFSYSLNNAQLADSGSKFSCLVTNAYGSASSTNVTLKVLDTIANDLCSGAILITNASYTNVQSTLKASAFGDPVPDCVDGFGHGVWYQFTAPVAGLLIVDTFGSDFDTGLALYTGSCDALTEMACNDDTGGITSQVILPTTTGTTYSILAGGYSSDAGNLVLHLNHLTPPAFVIQPTNISVVVSSNGNFSATLSGTLPMSFQWYFNSVPLPDGGRISGSTNATLNIANVQTNDGGNYQLVASNIVGVTTSSVAILTPIILPPVITQQPLDQSVLVGSNVTFTAGVDGTPPYSYQWFFNGSPLTDDGIHISGSATTSLSISNLTTADAGSYTMNVTNIVGFTNTTAAVLTVLVPPTITAQPIGRSVPVGLPTTFNAAASGIPAPSYQWQLNGTNLPGATSSSYTVTAVGTNNLGFYHLVASNSVGVAVSADAQLTFGPVAAWGRNLSNESLPPPGLSNVIAVAGTCAYYGQGVSYAVRTDGTVAAWGSGWAGGSLTNLPANVTNVVAISTYSNIVSYALRADGSVVGWAWPGVPALSNIVAVAAGNNFIYALRAEGTLIDWGNNIPTPDFPAGLNHLTAIASGSNNAVALKSDGTIAVSGGGVLTNIPAGLSNVVAVAAGYTYAMALKANGTVVAWGSGTGTNLPSGMTNIVAISAGNGYENFGLAIRSNGMVAVWGDKSYGETNPPAALTNLFSIAGAAAEYHGLALVNDGSPVIIHPPIGLTAYTGRDGTLHGDAAGAQPLSYQWLLNGTNIPGATSTSLVLSNLQFANAGNYQLFVSNSLNTALSLPAPVTVISNNTLIFLSQTSLSASNVYQGGKVTFYSGAVLGNGPLRYQWFFSPTNKNYTAVPGATNDTLVLDPALVINTGNYYIAVSNGFIQPPYQTYALTSAPVNVRVLFAKAWGYLAVDPPFNLTNAVAVAVGNAGTSGASGGHYLALRSDGKISPWGTSFSGETNVSALSNSIVTAVAAGWDDSLALKSDGTVYAWGNGGFGETNVPANLSGVTAIACGDLHDLALKSDGTVIGWGQNTYLQTTNAAATNVVAIAASAENSIALRADGSVVAWGQYGGQYQTPFNATNIVAVACGTSHFMALRANGTVVAWGSNPYGQTTVPATLSNVVAIAASSFRSVALRNDGTVVTWGSIYPYQLNNAAAPSDLANVVAISSSGEHDVALFGTRAPAFTVQPWNRAIASTARTNIILAAKCAGVQPVFYHWQLNGTNVSGATNDTLILTNSPSNPIHLIATGAYQLIASNAYGVAASKYAKVTTFIPLGDALDTPSDGKGNYLYNWTTSGNAQWFGETNATHDGVDAARSGGTGALQETILQTTVGTNQAGSYTFWWKVSSEQDFDFLEFRINGIVQTSISGEVDWQQVSIPVAAGTNVLQWRYFKDASFDAGQDAGWVDQFAFVPAPVILAQPAPASQTVNLGATLTWRIIASGVPTLKYQWWQNGTNPVGGNNSALTLSNVARAQNGTYSVTVTNAGGSVTSSVVNLKVLVPQVLGSPKLLPDGSFQLTSTDANGGQLSPSDLANFEAQASTNLVNWVTLPGALSLTNGLLQLQDSGSNYTTRYYRIVEH